MSDDVYAQTHKVVIAGTGPAGLTAAIYAARANLEPIVFEGEQPGGQLTITTDVENFPGFPEGVMGPELIDLMKKQAERFGTKLIQEGVESVDLQSRPFVLNLSSGKQVKTHTLIAASGAKARLLGLESESALMGYGVSACATCDGFFFRDKHVLIVGGGDTAMEEALFLTKFASRVTIIHRRDELRASKIMQDRVLEHDKIDVEWNSEIVEMLGVEDKKLKGVILKDTQTGETREYACDGVFIAIGHDPNIKFLNGSLKTNDAGYVLVDEPSTYTSVEGVFACGDVIDPNYRQAITAAGTGCRAAIDAERYIESKGLGE